MEPHHAPGAHVGVVGRQQRLTRRDESVPSPVQIIRGPVGPDLGDRRKRRAQQRGGDGDGEE